MTKTLIVVFFGCCILDFSAFAIQYEGNGTLTPVMNVASNDSMTVVLTPDDIKTPYYDIKAGVDDKAGNTQASQTIENNSTSISTNVINDVNHDSPTNQTQPLSQLPEQNAFQSTLPQVVHRTQTIGTPEQPTIDGGLMSAPDLVQTLPEAGTNEVINQVLLLINNQMMLTQDFMNRLDINYYNELMHTLKARVMLKAKTLLNRIVMLQLKAVEKPHRLKKRGHHGKT